MSDRYQNDDYTREEKQERFMRTLKAALGTPPDHHETRKERGRKAAVESTPQWKRDRPPKTLAQSSRS